MHKYFILIHLLYSSTCFEHYCSHLQEECDKCIKIKNLCIELVKKTIIILGCTVNKT